MGTNTEKTTDVDVSMSTEREKRNGQEESQEEQEEESQEEQDYLEENGQEENQEEQEVYSENTRSLRDRTKLKQPEWYNPCAMLAKNLTLKEALSSDEGHFWKETLDSKIKSLEEKTWILESLPPDRKAITNKWFFRVKEGTDGTVTRYTARLVARGLSQKTEIE